MERVLDRHPGLVLVVAHAGMPDYLGFAALADRHPRVHLDTTMLGTDFTQAIAPMPAGCRPGWPTWATGWCWARTSRTSRTRT